MKKTFHFSEGAKRLDFGGFVKGLAAKKIKIAIPCAPSAESVGGTDKNKASKPLKNLGLETLKKYYYYYETSHYRPLVGDMMVHRLLDEPKELNTDFGRYVTRENVDTHIEFLQAQLAQ